MNIGQIVDFLVSLLGQGGTVAQEIPAIAPQPPSIDWTNPQCKVSTNFTVGDCLTLHALNRLATEADGVDLQKLVILCAKMEQVVAALGCKVRVHCMFRSQAYNHSQGISPMADVHSFSEACDFDANENLTIQEVKDKIEPLLDQLGLRMERGTTSWIHVDLRNPGPSGRYFIP